MGYEDTSTTAKMQAQYSDLLLIVSPARYNEKALLAELDETLSI